MTSTEFKELNQIVSNDINNGHSFSMIIRNHKNEFSVGKRTLYNYVEKGYLDINNLDLPRKVRYKKRKRNEIYCNYRPQLHFRTQKYNL